MFQKRIGLRSLLIILSVGSVTLTSLLLLTALWVIQKENIEDSLLSSNIAYARKLADTTDGYFSTAQRELAYSAQQINTLSDKDKLQAETERLRLQSGFFNSVVIVTAKAVIAATSPESLDLVGQKLTSAATRHAIAIKKPFISSPFVSAAGNYVVFISQPIFDDQGHYLGFMGGSIYLKKPSMLSNIISQHFYEDDSQVSIVSDDGTVIYNHDPSLVGAHIAINPELKDKLVHQQSGKYLLTHQGQEYLLGYASLKATGWNIFIYGTSDNVQRILALTAENATWILLTVISLMIALVAWLSSRISMPLEKLAELTRSEDSTRTLKALPGIHAWYAEAANLREAVYHHVLMMVNRVSALNDEAMTDPLTGLYNRRGFKEMTRRYRHSDHHCLIALDIDHFKVINDEHGHDAGDAVLISLAVLLKAVCRESDIINRFGGEEFVIFLPDTALSEAIALAERIRKTVENTDFPYSHQMRLCGGVVSLQDEDNDMDAALRRADMALYDAKAAGRNRVMFSKGGEIYLHQPG